MSEVNWQDFYRQSERGRAEILGEMVLHECPYCHKLMAAKEIGKEEVDSNDVNTTMQSPNAGRTGPGGLAQATYSGAAYGLVLFDPSEMRAVLDQPRAFIAYRVKYQCKNCGKQWAKIHVEKRPLPREYIQDEKEGAGVADGVASEDE